MQAVHSGFAQGCVARRRRNPYFSFIEVRHGAGLLPDDRREKMYSLFESLKIAARNHARYVKTRDEIARMPLDIALDLGLDPGDADRIARKAVWG
jgi:uncharacterized protein YjiS (DUF1127 family)